MGISGRGGKKNIHLPTISLSSRLRQKELGPGGSSFGVGGKMIVRFVVVEPESKKGSHTVRLPLLVGRTREAKFRIQHERVSRRHCQFTVEDGVVFVRDLGSTNGTHLEGTVVPVDHPLRVPPGALVRVGSIGFLVEYDRFAETPTVELRANDLAAAETLGPGGDDRSDIDIRFEDDAPQAPVEAAPVDSAGAAPLRGLPSSDEKTDDDDEGDELRRLLEGLR
jgi:pSer/pThr/pTyr-binding forkhead associated (FHA) protein